jgi:hypothetical protein
VTVRLSAAVEPVAGVEVALGEHAQHGPAVAPGTGVAPRELRGLEWGFAPSESQLVALMDARKAA